MCQHDRLFAVTVRSHNHLIIVADGIINALGGILRCRNLSEKLLNLPLGTVHINVADNNNRLQVRTIPLLVVVAQILIGEVIYNIHRADRQTVLVFRTFVDDGQQVFHHPLRGSRGTPCAPFLVNHATLLVNLLILKQKRVAPVVQDKQARVDDSLSADGHGGDIIHRLVHAGVGIEIGSELHANRFAPRNDSGRFSFASEMFCSVERHVFKEVRQSALAGLFENTSHTLRNIKLCQSRFLCVVADVVGKSVFQLTHAITVVLTDALCGERCDKQGEECQQKGSLRA